MSVSLLLSFVVVFVIVAGVVVDGRKAIHHVGSESLSSPSSLRGGIALEAANDHMMKYHKGGRIVERPKIVPIFASTTFPGTESIVQYYKALVKGNFIDFLTQYNVKNQKFKDGSVTPAFTFDWTNPTSTVTYVDIAYEFLNAASMGQIPQASNNTIYAIHFQGTVDYLGNNEDLSCNSWCGLHGSFSMGGRYNYAYIMLIPDFASMPDCAVGCSYNKDNFPFTADNAAFATISHEVAEVMTNPDVAQDVITWYNKIDGEVADYCADRLASVKLGDGNTHTTQMMWSNKSKKCVAPKKGK